MDDLISRQAAIELFRKRGDIVEVGWIKELPSVEPQVIACGEGELSTNLAEVSTELINRQAAIDAIEAMQMPIMRSTFAEEQFVFRGMSDALNAIKELPSAEPQERKVGRWSNECGYPHVKCTVCGEEENAFSTYGWKFCPNCGARMEVDNEQLGH